MLVATQDTVTPTAIALPAFDDAVAPKELLMIEGRHNMAYHECFETRVSAARDWFVRQLTEGS
ncbi:MAG: hypothetical protein EXR86_04555 [Gammaproteobacteria bacterium]|nr:hypothetical protein [Gammaproteobacteria bacterium]